jgi:hypothetical protein
LSPSLQQRLKQAEEEALIRDVLASQTSAELADKLVSYFTGSDRDALLRLLEKYLKQVIVIKIKLNEFVPSKHTFEGGEIPQLVSEFTIYLQNQITGKNPEDQTIVIEIE